MAWTTFHSHCDFCDGAQRPRAMVEAALDRDFAALGFSSHAPLPFPSPWCIGRGLRPANLDRYRQEIESLKRFYRGRIAIHCGLEVDYIPGLIGPADRRFAEFDYRIGSVHFVGRTAEGAAWQMDDGPERFELGLDLHFGGDIRSLVETYYRSLAEMAWLERPDVIGHFDLVKKYNRNARYFREDEGWYRRIVEDCLSVIAASGSIVELNTGGMARGWTDEPYPSPWILSLCLDKDIPICLSSDAHEGAGIAYGFAEALSLFGGLGGSQLMTLTETGWIPVGFGREGLRLRPLKTAA